MRLRERLDGRRVLLTGVTGFVGEALLHRILRDLPGTTVVALVRRKGSQTGRDRVAQLLRKPIFSDIVNDDVDDVLDSRVEVIEGDLADIPPLPADLDVAVHCAGDVSFDPPIDEAFATNVLGTRRLLERLGESGSDAHYIHVSTAYVAGRRRGAIPERSCEHDVDWRAEAEWGRRMRARAEEQSRTPGRLARVRRQAERQHGRAGFITAAADAERRRREWVNEQLVKAGGERARSLGWTDVYTFTKALGERVVEELGAGRPVSIVRPSIIESALETPHPGWIEGFKMAEPLILAFGRGELPEFPAAPDSVVDVVPVDHVVGALVAVLAGRPEPGEPRYFHVTSGGRNPLTFHRLYEIIAHYFDRYPFDMGERGAVRLPAWRFPGGEAVERLLVASERAHKAADYLVTHVPRSERIRRIARDVDRQQRRLEFLRRYVDLYREYAQAELQFVDDATIGLHRALEPDDREVFGFDTAVVDWEHYLGEVHAPAVTEPLRSLDVVRRRRNAAAAKRSSNGLPEATDVVAAFDMDGTLLSSNVIETYLWTRLPELEGHARLAEVGRLLRRLPGYIQAERRDRGGFLRAVYRRYAGADLAELDRLVDETLAPHVLERVSAAALRRVRQHRSAGHRTILITGAIRPLTRPLAPLFDDIVAADLAVDRDGRCTGFLAAPPLVGESRAAWLRHLAESSGFDLGRSYAYADSHSDLPMLEVVGKPVAVSPDVHLWRRARRSQWEIVDWSSPGAVSRLDLPSAGVAEVMPR
ncbi:MAG: HAD-IB family hydrolase [Propionibacteriales bacterium]|nr:HAD-IB family hydrolase [Propionibacteriales bacterium]